MGAFLISPSHYYYRHQTKNQICTVKAEGGKERDMTRKAISIHRGDFTGATNIKRILQKGFPVISPLLDYYDQNKIHKAASNQSPGRFVGAREG